MAAVKRMAHLNIPPSFEEAMYVHIDSMLRQLYFKARWREKPASNLQSDHWRSQARHWIWEIRAVWIPHARNQSVHRQADKNDQTFIMTKRNSWNDNFRWVNKFINRFRIAANAEWQHSGMGHKRDGRIRFQQFRNFQSAITVMLHPQRQGHNTAHNQPGVNWD